MLVLVFHIYSSISPASTGDSYLQDRNGVQFNNNYNNIHYSLCTNCYHQSFTMIIITKRGIVYTYIYKLYKLQSDTPRLKSDPLCKGVYVCVDESQAPVCICSKVTMVTVLHIRAGRNQYTCALWAHIHTASRQYNNDGTTSCSISDLHDMTIYMNMTQDAVTTKMT